MKKTPFKNKYSALKRNSSLKRSTKRMRSFRKVEGENVLQVQEADRQFSLEIRNRDGCCVRCSSILFLGCSHFIGRGNYSTRYDTKNCITLCQECHTQWESEKSGAYKTFMRIWLGELGFEDLMAKSKLKQTPRMAIEAYMIESKILQDNDIQY